MKSQKENLDKVFEKLVLGYELQKNQSYVDRIMAEGELSVLVKLKKYYEILMESKFLAKERKSKNFKDDETSLKKWDVNKQGKKITPETYSLYKDLENEIIKAKEKICIKKSLEELFNKMNKNLEETLFSTDLLNDLIEAKKNKKYPVDVQLRIDSGKCALKRPGSAKKFSCDNEVVEGTKYCKEHLKKYDPITYTDIFPNEE